MAVQKVVVIGASTGGLKALRVLLKDLPADLPAAIFIAMHIGAWPSVLPAILQKVCPLPVRHPEDGEKIARSCVYIAPSDRHLLITDGEIRLSRGPKENFARPAIDPLFRSAAVDFGPKAIGIILTGELDDGAAGLRAISACGGFTMVQSPDSCEAASMPLAAMQAAQVDRVVPIDEMSNAITDAVQQGNPTRSVSMSERIDVEIETRIALTGQSSPQELDKIGTPSRLTCPDCGGVVWRIGDDLPLRYRCHTGHAFSALSLDKAQANGAEDALWMALRRLNERLLLAEDEAKETAEPSQGEATLTSTKVADIETARQALLKIIASDASASSV